jgi:hypothetical protein
MTTRRNSKKSSRYFTRLARPARLQPHLCGLIPSLSTLWPPSRPRRPHPPPPTLLLLLPATTIPTQPRAAGARTKRSERRRRKICAPPSRLPASPVCARLLKHCARSLPSPPSSAASLPSPLSLPGSGPRRQRQVRARLRFRDSALCVCVVGSSEWLVESTRVPVPCEIRFLKLPFMNPLTCFWDGSVLWSL